MALYAPARGRDQVRIRQPHVLDALVEQAHEAIDSFLVGVAFLVSERPGDGDRRVVPGGQHHPVEQVAQGVLLTDPKAHQSAVRPHVVAFGVAQVEIRRCQYGVEGRHFERLNGREHLGDTGDANTVVGFVFGEDVAGLGVDHDVMGGGKPERRVVLAQCDGRSDAKDEESGDEDGCQMLAIRHKGRSLNRRRSGGGLPATAEVPER